MNPKPPIWRILNRDGSLNIRNDGAGLIRLSDLYYSLLATTWPRFILFIALIYMLLNFIFAEIFYVMGPAALAGEVEAPEGARFLSCFFFSVHTLATIGYGSIAPANTSANIVVALEALTGLLCFAVMTGLFFIRFAKARPRIAFSSRALISELDGKPCLHFRLANKRLNEISDARLVVTLVISEFSGDQFFRRLHTLKLERDRSPLFALTWTAVHVIDETSPLHGLDAQALAQGEAEIVVNLFGTDETLSQPLTARFSYTAEDIQWGGAFSDMITRDSQGRLYVELSKIDSILPSEPSSSPV